MPCVYKIQVTAKLKTIISPRLWPKVQIMYDSVPPAAVLEGLVWLRGSVGSSNVWMADVHIASRYLRHSLVHPIRVRWCWYRVERLQGTMVDSIALVLASSHVEVASWPR